MEFTQLCPVELGCVTTSFAMNPKLVLREEFVDRLDERVVWHVDTIVWGSFSIRHTSRSNYTPDQFIEPMASD